jgi:ribosomal protein S18 acetylase RimI-like enzyme
MEHATRLQPTVRSITLGDLDVIFSIDHKLRATGKTITYANLTTERLFTIDRHVGRLAKPVSYIDLIRGDITELLELGFVAEVEGHVRGFVLGRISHLGEGGGETGVIVILGVHPDYQRQGIATALVEAIGQRFRERGARTLRIAIDHTDKELQAFFEGRGFGVGRLIEYTRRL